MFDGVTYRQDEVIRTNLRPRRIALFKNELWVEIVVRLKSLTSKLGTNESDIRSKGFRPEQMTPVDILFNDPANEVYIALGSANHVAVVDVATREITKYILVGRRAGVLVYHTIAKLLSCNGLSDDFTLIDIRPSDHID